MFNPLGFVMGWNRRVRKLRKSWDRTREKSLKKKGVHKAKLLTRLDQIELNLRLIEERRLSRIERNRLAKEIEIDIEEAKTMLKMKEEELRSVGVQPRPQAQQPEQKYQ